MGLKPPFKTGTKTADSMALEILLTGGPRAGARLKRLRVAVEAIQEGRVECPECGDEGPHDDNGATKRSELAWCCRKCGTHMDAEEI